MQAYHFLKQPFKLHFVWSEDGLSVAGDDGGILCYHVETIL